MTGSDRVDIASCEARAADGWTLRGDLHTTRAEPRAVALLAHAMMVDRRTMDRPRGAGLAATLARAGIAAMSFDLRGHGESRPSAAEGAVYTYDDFVRLDLPAIVGAARERFPGSRVVVVGHSLGGHAALIAAGRSPDTAPDAVVAIAANLWLPSLEPSALRRVLKRAVFFAWGAASRGGVFDPRRFRAGTDPEPAAYVRQFVEMYREDRLASPDGSVDYAEALRRADLPVLSIASEGDRLLANPEAVDRFMRLLERARVERRIVRHGELGGRAPGHMELVTRASSRPLWEEVARWIVAGVA